MSYNNPHAYSNFGNRNRVSTKRRLFSMRRGTGVPFGLIVAGFVLLIVALFTAGIVVEHMTLKTVTFTVSDKAVTVDCSSSGHNSSCDHTYMIYGTNGQVYEDTDTISFLKFNSSNIYGQLQRGHTYTCRVTGFRIPLLSTQQNIIDCK
jgi:hypothetical protein